MSEENKNLNEQPEAAPVEKKEEAPVAKKPLTKQQIGIIAGIAAAVVVLIVVLALVLGGGKDPHSHSFVDGKCECGESSDPNYVPPHTHSYVEGKCECGATDPSYVPDGPAVTEQEYKLGLGLVYGNITNKQINATLATVVLDKDGKIVAVKLDAIQNKFELGDSVEFTELRTKKELGDEYGMAGKVDNNGDGVMLEWFEQVAALEEYLIGKTLEEVKAIETHEVNSHFIAKDEALLSAGCTIQITDFIAAVVKACEDEFAVSFETAGDIALGLAANNANDGSIGDDFEATIKMNIDFAATVVVDGKIVAALNDATQPKVVIEDGVVLSADVGKNDAEGNSLGLKTKRELKEGYGMAGKAFSEYVVGKTAAEVAGLETTLVNGHYISTDEALLNAGCTIQITGIQSVVAEAVENAD